MADESGISLDDVHKVAKLARLALSEEQMRQYQPQLHAVLGYMDRLREINTEGVEPMSHPTDQANRLDEDQPREPSAMLPTEALMAMAPEKMEPFVKVPKVIGEGAA